MDEDIKKAIDLLESNDYIIIKMTQSMYEAADECAETGYGDCTGCPCFICAAGLE